MATDKEASSLSCASDPNFAVICSFLDKFSNQCGITFPSFAELQDMLEDTQTVSQVLVDLHVKLLRKARKSFVADKWERALAKFCHTYSQQDGWELERFGYKKARLEVKVKLLKVLLETQFDVNAKFKTEVNKLSPVQLRLEPLGRDQTGLTYWCQFDPSSNVRVYREDVDEESWELVAKDRDGLVQLIDSLSNGEGQQELNSILNEDSTSQEIEKPITDTGQNRIEDEIDDEDEEEEEEDEDEGSEQDVENNKETMTVGSNKRETIEESNKDIDEESNRADINEESKKVQIDGESNNADIDEESNNVDVDEESNNADIDEESNKADVDEESNKADVDEESNNADVDEESNKADVDEESNNADVDEESVESEGGKEAASEPHSNECNSNVGNLEIVKSSVLPETKEKRTNGQISIVIKGGTIQNGVNYSSDTNESCLSNDLGVKSEPRNYSSSQLGNFYMVPDRDPLPETADILSQMSMKFNEKREAEDLSNPSKKPKIDHEGAKLSGRSDRLIAPDDQPITLVKKIYKPADSSDDEPISLVSGATLQRVTKEDGNSQPEVSEAIEEPIHYVVGAGSGAECKTGNVKHSRHESEDEEESIESDFSEVIEEPVFYVVGHGTGLDCDVGNPMQFHNSDDNDEPPEIAGLRVTQALNRDPDLPEFSNIIEEPVRYIRGHGSGAECGVGSPRHTRNINQTSNQAFATMGIECSLHNLSFSEFEPSFSDVIEEPVMFVKGYGYGRDCLTGNNEEKAEASTEENNPEKKTKLWSINSICPEKNEEGSPLSPKDSPLSPKDMSKNEVNSLKPLSEVKPREENIPMKDKPPDDLGIKDNYSKNNANSEEKEVANSLLNSCPNELLKMKPLISSIPDNDLAGNSITSNCSNKCENSDDNSSKSVELVINKKNSEDCFENCTTNLEKTSNKEVLKNDLKESTYSKANEEVVNEKVNLSTTKNSEDAKSSNGIIENGPEKADEVALLEEDGKNDQVDESDNNVCDKKPFDRKNVMLTNIIEICLDNNTIDNITSDLKEDDGAKYIELFTAKDLINPPNIVKDTTINKKNSLISDEKETLRSSEEESSKSILKNENKVASSKLEVNVKKEIKYEVKTEEDVDNKTDQLTTIKSGDDVKKESSDEEVKVEKNIVDEEKCEEETTNSNKKIKNIHNEEGSCKEIKNVDHVEENPEEEDNDAKSLNKDIVNDETDVAKEKQKQSLVDEDKNEENSDIPGKEDVCLQGDAKMTGKSRKSRTNSLNDEKETEIPNKKSKTDKIEIKPARRSSRRNNSLSSQSSELKKPENKEDKESTNNEVEKNTEIEDVKNSKSDNENKEEKTKNEDVTLSSFSMDAETEEGLALGKPNLKNQNRKRRSSMRLSRSEEDAGEPPEDEEEAGGKKPRLKGKARRSKGKMVPSKPPPPESSSDEEQGENNEIEEASDENQETPVKKNVKRRPIKNRRAKTKSAFVSKKRKPNNPNKSDKSEGELDRSSKKKLSPKKLETPPKKVKVEVKGKSADAKKSNDSTQSKRRGKATSADEKKNKKAPPLKQKKTKDGKPEEAEDGKEKDNKEEENIEEGGDLKNEEQEKEEADNKDNLPPKKDDITPQKEEEKPPVKKSRSAKRKTLLGLTEWDLVHTKKAQEADDAGGNVRQSRRIAQIKIKEEAERRAIEEATMLSLKEVKKKKKDDKDDNYKDPQKKTKKKKGRIERSSEEEDATFKEPPKEEKRGRKKKKGHDRLKFDEHRPWQSSSGSSTEEPEDEEDHFEEEDDEEDIRTKKIVSDHEFSPESDLEKDDDDLNTSQPVRRARTAKKVDEEPDVEAKEKEEDTAEDFPCKKCGQPDHPEWILLCDKCDSGYHASCLRPPIMLIPEGDWFCPPCQHADLVAKLRETLRTFEKDAKKRENEELRRKRLAYVGISLANVLPSPDKHFNRGSHHQQFPSTTEESESSEEESESSSEEEPVYQLRQRRAAVQANYRFNDYDELINSAIQDEMEAVKGAGNMGRGKDIQNIVDAEKNNSSETKDIGDNNDEEKLADVEEEEENWRPRVVPKITALPSLRKKHKKLTDLDMPSDDDGSDEDFKGSSAEEEFSSSDGNDSDDSVAKVPVRRSERARQSRIDREFINDDDSESSDEPRKKKTRRLYASSSSESSGSWGRRKRKSKSYSRIKSYKGKKKSTKYFDSDSDTPKKVKSKRPKIKYGISSDEDEAVKPTRTRGKKVSYLDVQGSDTEEEVIRRSRKLPSEDEEEFVPDKEEEEEEHEKVDDKAKKISDKESEEESDEESEEKYSDDDKEKEDVSKKNDIDKTAGSAGEVIKDLKEPAVIVERIKAVETSRPAICSENEDDEVEEEEIEEEIEEEVEEEEEEEIEEKSEPEGKPEEAKNLAIPKLRVIQPSELIRSDLVRKGVTLTMVKAPETAQPKPSTQPLFQPLASSPVPKNLAGHHIPPSRLHIATPVSAIVTAPPPVVLPVSSPQPKPTVIKTEVQDLKKEEKEDKKEATVPAIRLVPSAKLLDPNKARRPIEEGVIRGMLGGGGFYRPPHPQQRVSQPAPGVIPPAAGYHGRQTQRYPEQQRYSMYQPPHQLPPPSHQFFPQSGRYYQPASGEDYGAGGYEDPPPPVPAAAQQVIGASGVIQGTDEDGVFSGLVSYFSSQREDPLDS